MHTTKQKAVLITYILKGEVLPAKRFFMRMGKRLSEAASQLRLASPSAIHWSIGLCLLTYLKKGI